MITLRLLAALSLHFRRLTARDPEAGATAVEYALLVALIAIVIIGVVAALGTNLSGLFSTVSSEV
jgi:pilus assembly protein Flp/PilA